MILRLSYVFLFCLLITSHSYARKSPNRLEIGRTLKRQTLSIKEIEKTILKLERKLGSENEKYLDIIKAKTVLDKKFIKLNKEYKRREVILKKQLDENSKMMALNLVQGFNENVSASDLLVKKILLKQLVKTKKQIKRLIHSNIILKKRMNNLKDRFYSYNKTQSFITKLLRDLENQKSILAKNYVRKIKQKESLADKIKSKRKRKRKIVLKGNDKLKFFSPISSYESIDYNKKGVSFKFLGKKVVRSTKAGVVVYSGKLSTYGNVIMIDHGKDTRSVILGQFKPSVKKGKKLRKGQVIGQTRHTFSSSKIAGKLYFEVRKKNKVQNTILLMDKKFLKKNNLLKIINT